MAEFTIPCETVVRFAKILCDFPGDVHESFKTVRFEDNLVIATNRSYMAVEEIGGGNSGVFHMRVTDGLLEQCRQEAQFNSRLTVTVTEMLKHAVGKTSYGYVTPDNVGYFEPLSEDWPRWRNIVGEVVERAPASRGGMFWNLRGVQTLIGSSPSGQVVFEENIDTNRPALIRDIADPNWIGLFKPHNIREIYQPATLPSWAAHAARKV